MRSLLLPLLLLAATVTVPSVDAGTCTAQQYNCLGFALCNWTGSEAVCSCPPGFSGNGKTSQCIDINECHQSPCPTGSRCVNQAGGYFCSCPVGSTMLVDANNQTCQQITSTISGVVVSSRNKHLKYANKQVSLFTMIKEARSSLIGQTMTDAQGKFDFDVDFGGRYMTCTSPTGYEACVVHTVKALSTFLSSLEHQLGDSLTMDPNGGLSTTNGTRRRRLTDLSSLNIPVPSYLLNYEWEIHTIWAMDSAAYSCDWDTTVLSTINSGCHAAYKSSNNGECYSTGRAVTVFEDSKCDYDSFGFETVLISETGTRTYQHMVYGYGANSSFASAANAQGQVNVYRRGSNGPVLAYSMSLSSAIRSNFNDRFWHTFSLYINTPANNIQGTGSVTEKNVVTCTPEQTTGSNSTLNFENGSRHC